MKLTEKQIDEFKEIYEKKEGKEISRQEAYEAAQNLANFFEPLYELAEKDIARKRRLKKEPDGFPVDGQYSCLVCNNSINESNGWYDWYGQTCLVCRKAIKDGIIPTFVCTHRDSYFSISSLRYTFDIKHQTAKKYIREGKLIPRIILNEQGGPHEYIFLKKENPALIHRKTAIWKSIMRNKDKVNREQSRKFQKEMREKLEKELKKMKK